jgi:tetratricopeptide (TPR) repeat protein
VRLAPMHPLSHNLMGMILTEAQRPQPGEFHYRRVIELTRARDPIVLANLAWNLKGQGRLAEARQLYEESVEAEPNVFQTWFGWGQLEEADGNFAAARSRLDRAARIRPNDPGLRVARATLLSREGNCLDALAELETDPNGSQDRTCAAAGSDPNVLLEKGRILDRLQRYDEAFACFDEAKRRAREATGKSYFDRQAREVANRLREFFVGDRIRLHVGGTGPVQSPEDLGRRRATVYQRVQRHDTAIACQPFALSRGVVRTMDGRQSARTGDPA